MPYLLHEHLMALLAPSNHPRIQCGKNQTNSFEPILEDVPYSIVVENIIAKETRDMFKVFAMFFLSVLSYMYILYIQFGQPEKA